MNTGVNEFAVQLHGPVDCRVTQEPGRIRDGQIALERWQESHFDRQWHRQVVQQESHQGQEFLFFLKQKGAVVAALCNLLRTCRNNISISENTGGFDRLGKNEF